MDMEDVKTTLYDILRMAGDLEISSWHLVFRTQLETDVIHSFGKDGWRQIPAKIMIGNVISWVCIISLDFWSSGAVADKPVQGLDVSGIFQVESRSSKPAYLAEES